MGVQCTAGVTPGVTLGLQGPPRNTTPEACSQARESRTSGTLTVLLDLAPTAAPGEAHEGAIPSRAALRAVGVCRDVSSEHGFWEHTYIEEGGQLRHQLY